MPLQKGKYTIGPEDVEPHIDENTIGVAAVLGTTFTGHRDDIVGINDLLIRLKDEKGIDIPMHVDAASGGFVWPFLYPHSEWDFRLEQVRSINVSGHKFGLVYPGIGWLIFRDKDDLAQDLVFEENYLGKTDATFTLNFSTGSAMVLAQYYNFVRLGREGYAYIIGIMEKNARYLVDRLSDPGDFALIDPDAEQLPLVAFQLVDGKSYDEFDVAWQLSAERGWMVPAYTLPPNAQDVKVMRALVKETLSHAQIDHLASDIKEACATLEKKGGLMESERQPGEDRHRLLTVSMEDVALFLHLLGVLLFVSGIVVAGISVRGRAAEGGPGRDRAAPRPLPPRRRPRRRRVAAAVRLRALARRPRGRRRLRDRLGGRRDRAVPARRRAGFARRAPAEAGAAPRHRARRAPRARRCRAARPSRRPGLAGGELRLRDPGPRDPRPDGLQALRRRMGAAGFEPATSRV